MTGYENHAATERQRVVKLIPSVRDGAIYHCLCIELGKTQHRRRLTPQVLICCKAQVFPPLVSLVGKRDAKILVDGLTANAEPVKSAADTRTEPVSGALW